MGQITSKHKSSSSDGRDNNVKKIQRFLNKSNFIDFLKEKMTAETCGADYPGYCGTASMILGVYLHGKYGFPVELVSSLYVPANEIHNHAIITIDGKKYVIDPTVSQFDDGPDRIVFEPLTRKNYRPSKEEVHIFTLEDMMYLYKPEWDEYLINIYNHRNLIV